MDLVKKRVYKKYRMLNIIRFLSSRYLNLLKTRNKTHYNTTVKLCYNLQLYVDYTQSFTEYKWALVDIKHKNVLN